MARPKKPPHPLLHEAAEYLRTNVIDLNEARLTLHQLDGPPDAPRFAVTAIECKRTGECPYGVHDEEHCAVLDCSLRLAVRLLYNREGKLITVRRSTIRWLPAMQHHDIDI